MKDLFKIILLNIGKIVGLLVSFFLGLFLIIFGFWKTLLLISLVLLGYLLGKLYDEGVSFPNLIKNFFASFKIDKCRQ